MNEPARWGVFLAWIGLAFALCWWVLYVLPVGP